MDEDKPTVPKTTTDIQRIKLEKLMKNPDKPVVIPDRPKDRKNLYTPEFVRNVMGSSAGAGSGEFHVYRHLRRKEYARQKMIDESGKKDVLDDEYHQKLDDNQKQMDGKTAKKRAKRLKRKQRQKLMKGSTENKKQSAIENEDTSSDETEEETATEGKPQEDDLSQ